jgi:cardiolipin synthase A/B
LEAGVRIFEWKGSMLHAKTAVADGRWARVGSTNLNVASWIGNCELDVIVEDGAFARQMEGMYLNDLENSTEIVLGWKHKVHPTERRNRKSRQKGSARGSAGRAATGILALGSTVGAALTSQQMLGTAEIPPLTVAAVILLAFAGIAAYWPHVISVTAIILCTWMALTLLFRAFRLWWSHRREK